MSDQAAQLAAIVAGAVVAIATEWLRLRRETRQRRRGEKRTRDYDLGP